METNHASKNENKKHTYFPAETPSYPKFQWRCYGYGRFALCLIMLISEEKIKQGETYTRKFRPAGLTNKWLHEQLLRFMPWFPKLFLAGRKGSPLKPDDVYQRWHKMAYETKPGPGNSYTVGQSKEHPRNDKRLQPILEYVEVLYKKNKELTPSQVSEACSKVGIVFGYLGKK